MTGYIPYDISAVWVTSRSHVLLLNQEASEGDGGVTGENAARPIQDCGLTFVSVNGTISSCVNGDLTGLKQAKNMFY